MAATLLALIEVTPLAAGVAMVALVAVGAMVVPGLLVREVDPTAGEVLVAVVGAEAREPMFGSIAGTTGVMVATEALERMALMVVRAPRTIPRAVLTHF